MMRNNTLGLFSSALLAVLFGTAASQAADTAPRNPESNPDKNNGKLQLEKVVENVYAIVGPLGNRTPANLGNNATFGFLVTPEGVVLIDSGGTYKGAQRIHQAIKSVTDKPVKFVINTGGQDHRWLGNDYFKRQGAKVIASKQAVVDQKSRLKDIYFVLSNTAGDKAIEGTVESYADIQFDDRYELSVGGVKLQVVHPGAAHSPGDAYVWLPAQKVVFSGDIIYTQRLLSVMAFSSSKSWVHAFEAVAALQPEHVVPGHGKPTTLQTARQSTYEYLTTLRNKVAEFMDQGGVIQDVSKIDQSQFSYLENYDSLKGRNVQQIYQEMEWE
ncbi:MAG: MBL fold metallo-hydrolase [Gammaproteobacteria bacterium]|nr:MBL fold metallo-hydrolase [Gammaproteobacteria bacterium]